MNKTTNILLIEDDKSICSFITTALSGNGYHITSAYTGKEGLCLASVDLPDIILLDLGLPDIDGCQVLKNMRDWSDIPIIVISARVNEDDKVLALDLGADDYVTKPFNPVEVCARVKAQLRRYTSFGGADKRDAVLTIGDIEMDDNAKVVKAYGEPVSLTPTEYDILRLLMQNPDKVFSSNEIYNRVWNDVAIGAENTVAVHIRHLREKLELNPAEPRYLKVVWGQGYKIGKGDR